MKTVIMAGGKGTRISSLFSDIPKPMIRIAGKPVLEHELECLRDQGFTDIVITVSHLGDVITGYFGDGSGISPATGKPFGVNIEYFNEEVPLGNAGALLKMRDRLTDDFLLLNADAMFDIDFRRFVEFHRTHGAAASILTHPNSHPYDSGLIIADGDHRVLSWLTREDPRPEYYDNRVNAGLHVLDPHVLDDCGIDPAAVGLPGPDGKPVKVDLDRNILKPLAGTGRLYCYDSPEYVKDMGTPERFEAVSRDFNAGIVRARNLSHRQKAIFLDRDGTINRYVGFLRDPADLELIPGVAEAVRCINASGYLAVVVTNQPVIARGEVTVGQLDMIHRKMATELGKAGAFTDALYYCPHHLDKGFEGEVSELKFDCGCRKPKPGMLLRAARDLNIDLASSWMIGDSEADVAAGRAAGCRTVLLPRDAAGALGEALDRILNS